MKKYRESAALLFLALSQLIISRQASSQTYGAIPFSNVPNTWTLNETVPINDGSKIDAILLRKHEMLGWNFGCGFYCKAGDSFLFAVFIVYTASGSGIMSSQFPVQLVWSANRDRPVKWGATLEFKNDGNLVLLDADRSFVWSTGTSGKSVVGMNLTLSGNLQLVDGAGRVIWQSFDHPTDVLLSGQELSGNKRLVAALSRSNPTSQGIFYFSPIDLGAYVNATPPQRYSKLGQEDILINGSTMPCYLRARNGHVIFVANSTPISRSTRRGNDEPATSPPPPSVDQFLKLEHDGHLLLYEFVPSAGWNTPADLLKSSLVNKECSYPTICGKYGICTNAMDSCSNFDVCPNARTICRCPDSRYFEPDPAPDNPFDSSCKLTTPLSCGSSQSFETLRDVSYFNFIDRTIPAPLINETTEEQCKDACLKNCSCKAALIRYNNTASKVRGTCYLPTELFSIMAYDQLLKKNTIDGNATIFIKVQDPPAKTAIDQPAQHTAAQAKNMATSAKVGIAVGSIVLGLICAAVLALLLWRKRHLSMKSDSDAFIELQQLPGMPKMFSLSELEVATDGYARVLGKGGFATVFEGTLPDGTKVAVKRLEGVGQMIKEFVAEVQIIGRIHHVNLLSLIGFCAEKAQRMLVYQYMAGGSLDRWIFHENEGCELEWGVRKRIIYQVAKGLLYLHEECSPRIFHLDIKPHNILLDENCNAKVSDFGLSKLMINDHSFIMTTMRGTRGYMAPEWLSTSKITEKVDVYSFGVLVVEIVCGRRNLDSGRNQSSVHLLALLNDMNTEGQLQDFIMRYCHGTEYREEEAMEMLRLAVWCLQSDPNRRPSMSSVIKVLEDTIDVPDEVDSNFLTEASSVDINNTNSSSSAPLIASVLSGPR